MAKSKFPKKIVGIGAGVGVTAVLLWLFVLPIILVAPNIAPQADPDQFEIPIPLPPEVEEMNEEIIDEIIDVIEDPVVNDQCEPFPDCITEQIDGQIGDLVEEIEVPPPINNQTMTSEDPPLEQICDQDPENILCQVISPPTALQLKSITTKIDSEGVSTVQEDLFAFAFLVEEPTDRDFRTGFLESELIIISDPLAVLDASGEVDVLINGQSILTQPLKIGVMGTTNEAGELALPFLSPTGQPSDKFTFSFADNFNIFENEKINLVEIKIKQLDVTKDNLEEFSMVEQVIFEIEINKDANRIIVTDEEGITARIYPTDSRLIVNSLTNNVQGGSCNIGIFGGGGSQGSTTGTFPDDCIGTSNSMSHGTVPAPSITGIILLDSNNQLITTSSGGTGKVFDELLTRNANYTLKFSSPAFDVPLKYGKSQETQSYSCKTEGTPKFKVTANTVPPRSGCGFTGSCFSTTYYYLQPDGFTTGGLQCNFP